MNMKQGWEIKKLGQVCDIINGRNQKMVECVDGAYPIYGSGGIMGYASQFLCKAGTTIIGRKGTINKPIYVEEPFWNVDTAFGFQPKSTLNSKLLHYFCLHFDFLKLNKGTTIPSLVKADLLQIDMPYTPSIAEQQRIVEILDREFEKIDALKANAERNLQHAKDLFQAALKQELQPKDGWVTIPMGNVCELKQGLAINAKTKHLLVEKSKLPLLRIKDLKDGTREIFVNESECPQGCRAYPEDIIYTRTGTLGLVFTGVYGVMHNNCFKIEIDKEKIDKYYLMYYLQQDSFRSNIVKLASRAAQPDITHKLFKEQVIYFPTITEQVAIAHKLSDIREHYKTLEGNYTKTIALCDDMKQAFLRQAFNGEL